MSNTQITREHAHLFHTGLSLFLKDFYQAEDRKTAPSSLRAKALFYTLSSSLETRHCDDGTLILAGPIWLLDSFVGMSDFLGEAVQLLTPSPLPLYLLDPNYSNAEAVDAACSFVKGLRVRIDTSKYPLSQNGHRECFDDGAGGVFPLLKPWIFEQSDDHRLNEIYVAIRCGAYSCEVTTPGCFGDTLTTQGRATWSSGGAFGVAEARNATSVMRAACEIVQVIENIRLMCLQEVLDAEGN